MKRKFSEANYEFRNQKSKMHAGCGLLPPLSFLADTLQPILERNRTVAVLTAKVSMMTASVPVMTASVPVMTASVPVMTASVPEIGRAHV